MAPADLLLSYYGDDLTGSTDVMEALELGGVPAVLFLREPDATLLARFPHVRAVGLAGTSRSETPEWMDTHLTAAFRWLKGLSASLCHYKVCSTFDSSPEVGSIGRAIEIGRDVFGQRSVPLVVGAPQLRRWTAFGQLFAGYNGKVFRIDRHPVMSRHPVTPMDEADLLLHLSRQTDLSSNLIDIAVTSAEARAAAVDRLLADDTAVLLFDVDGPETQKRAGADLWRLREAAGPFVVGSSGVEYALLAEWGAQGVTPGPACFTPPGPVDRLAVVSGSVSPTTERQIRHAMHDGFDGIALDPVALVSEGGERAVEDAVRAGTASLSRGQSVILYSALGPSADRSRDLDGQGARHRLARMLGQILARLVGECGLSRAVIAGGDTSSHALRELEVQALTVRLPLPATPGSPLCLAHRANDTARPLELAFKGGQVGKDNYFSTIRSGNNTD